MLYTGNEPSDVAGCAQLCLLDKLTGIQPPSPKRALLGETPGRGLCQEQSRRQAGEARFGNFSLLHAGGRICLQRLGKAKRARLFPHCLLTTTDTAARRRTGEGRPAVPAPQSELLPETQRKKMLQQVGSVFQAASHCLSSSLTSVFQRGTNSFFAPSSERYLK